KQAALDAKQRKLTLTQQEQGLEADRRSLEQLREGVVLPGGKALSTDPKKAIAQLKALAAKSPANKFAIQDFITQYENATTAITSDKLGVQATKLGNARAKAEQPFNQATDKIKVKKDMIDNENAVKTTALRIKGDILAVEQDAAAKTKT